MDKKKNSMKKKKISRTKKEERVLHNLYQIKNIVLFNLNFFFLHYCFLIYCNYIPFYVLYVQTYTYVSKKN